MSSKPVNVKRSLRPVYLIVTTCFLVSFIWSTLPMMGWSSYKREGLMANCNIDWHEKSLNNLSYFIVVWTFDFIVPLICIFFCLFKSLLLVNNFLAKISIIKIGFEFIKKKTNFLRSNCQI